MTGTVIAALFSFAATNVDDLFINMLFFAQADSQQKALHIVLGKYLGIGALFLVSLAGAGLLHALPIASLRLLGVVPIVLGVRAWLRRDEEDSSRSPACAAGGLLLSTALVTIANGADNIGVYMPLLSSCSAWQIAATAAVFALMTAVWCLVSRRLANLPLLRSTLTRYRHIAVPIVLIALGVYILV